MSRCDLHVLSSAVLCVAIANTHALAAQAAPRTSPAITVADLRSRLFRIADDSMLGRETGSKGASQTADYVAAEFRRLGLKPAGERGSWFQVVPFWVQSPVASSLMIDGRVALRLGTDYVLPSRSVTAAV